MPRRKQTLFIGSVGAGLLLSAAFVSAADGGPPPKDERRPALHGRGADRLPAQRWPRRQRDGTGPAWRLVGMSDEEQPRFRRGEGRTRGPGPRGERPGRRRPLTPEEFAEEFDEIQQFLQEQFPERLGELRRFRRTNPDGFRRHVGRMIPRLRRIMDMLERNPQAGQLMLREERIGFQIQRLVDQYFEVSDPNQVRRLRREIRGLVEEQFDVLLEMREHEVQRLERRLEAIRTRLTRDRERREQRIEQSLGDLGIFED